MIIRRRRGIQCVLYPHQCGRWPPSLRPLCRPHHRHRRPRPLYQRTHRQPTDALRHLRPEFSPLIRAGCPTQLRIFACRAITVRCLMATCVRPWYAKAGRRHPLPFGDSVRCAIHAVADEVHRRYIISFRPRLDTPRAVPTDPRRSKREAGTTGPNARRLLAKSRGAQGMAPRHYA
jgi:hypothetical protein